MSLPYLQNRWDRIDEYHQLDSKVSKESVINWFTVCFKEFKIKNFKDVKKIQEYQLLNLAQKNSDSFYGTFEVDFWGGMFHTMGLYGQCFFNDWFPEELRYSKRNEKLYSDRFDWIYTEVNKI